MPVDRAAWAERLELSNFINAYYEYRDLRSCGDVRKVLIVGPGQGLDTVVLRWRGYEVTRLDIDETFRPEFVGSVHRMDMFSDGAFDAVVASHVLEHLSETYLDDSLREIARVGRFALLYLPVTGISAQWRFRSTYRDLDLAARLDLRKPGARADPARARFMEGQHFWEVGLPGFRVRDLLLRFGQWFEVLDCYRNRDWLPSQNFVLKSRRPPATGEPR
jgi:hypothetical protein